MPEASGVTMSLGKPCLSAWKAETASDTPAPPMQSAPSIPTRIGELRRDPLHAVGHPRHRVAAVQGLELRERDAGSAGDVLPRKSDVGESRSTGDTGVKDEHVAAEPLDLGGGPRDLGSFRVERADQENRGSARSRHIPVF